LSIPIPPAHLAYKISGSEEPQAFLDVGKRCRSDIDATLSRVNRAVSSFHNILDFGCGPGRTLRWFEKEAAEVNFYGTDVDAEAIGWCREHLPFAATSVNGELPPTKYSRGMFDFIYAISVFTHLREDYQNFWLNELMRITARDGYVLVSLLGQKTWDLMTPENFAKFQADGFLFSSDQGEMNGLFPDYYGIACQTKEYVFRHFSDYFTVVDYIPAGLNDHQDIVLLRQD
jgi:SAM-dependent methyltransferase